MFTEDVFAFYGGKTRFGESVQVQTGRIFIILITLFAYAVALQAPETIFELAIQYAFSGFASLSPLLIAALFWRGKHEVGRVGGDSLDRGGSCCGGCVSVSCARARAWTINGHLVAGRN